jgi:hypothetical protein
MSTRFSAAISRKSSRLTLLFQGVVVTAGAGGLARATAPPFFGGIRQAAGIVLYWVNGNAYLSVAIIPEENTELIR